MNGEGQQKFVDESWGFPQEREFLENLLCQRFNFLLVFFGLVVAGALTCQQKQYLLIVLWLGWLITSALSFTIAAVQWTLSGILSVIFKDPDHPISFGHRLNLQYNVRWIIGYLIPAICSLALLIMAIQATRGILKLNVH